MKKVKFAQFYTLYFTYSSNEYDRSQTTSQYFSLSERMKQYMNDSFN